MEHDAFIDRRDLGGNPPHVEYKLTQRGRLLLPFVDALKRLGETLDCNECEDRREQRGDYCEACPHRSGESSYAPSPSRRHELDDSIVLL
jgi:hypothetical protein